MPGFCTSWPMVRTPPQPHDKDPKFEETPKDGCNIGALKIREGFWGIYCTLIILSKP